MKESNALNNLITELIESGEKNGFLTIESIMTALEKASITLLDLDFVCEKIFSKGIKILDSDAKVNLGNSSKMLLEENQNEPKKEDRMILSTGIVREIDELGRIVIPKEIRKRFNYKEGDEIEIIFNGDEIRLCKHHITCVLCEKNNYKDEHIIYKDKIVCMKCIKEIMNAPI